MKQNYKFSIKNHDFKLSNSVTGKETIYYNGEKVSEGRSISNSKHEFNIGEDRFMITLNMGLKLSIEAKINGRKVPVEVEKKSKKIDIHEMALLASIMGIFTFRKVIFGNAHMVHPEVAYIAITISIVAGIWGGYHFIKKNKGNK